MRRRSLITTIFCLGEIAFLVIILIQVEDVVQRVQKWNRHVKSNSFKKPEKVLGCGSVPSPAPSLSPGSTPGPTIGTNLCCDPSNFTFLSGEYDRWIKTERKADGLQAVTLPLIVIVGTSLYAAVVINSGSINFTSLAIKMCHKFSERCLKKLAAVFWFACWGTEAVVSVFAITWLAFGLMDLTPSKFRFQDLCKDSGQKQDETDLVKARCFRKLGICPTLEEQSLFASILLCFYVLFCIVSKISFRIFMDGEDNDRPKCENCCKWSRLTGKCCRKKPQAANNPKDKKVKGELGADSVISLHLDDFEDAEQQPGPSGAAPATTNS